MKDFRSLVVWQKAHACVLEVYRLTKAFPRSEQFGLSSQLRRAAVSIPSNLAEGCARGSDADFARFVQMAIGSSAEVDYQLLLARDLEYVAEADFGNASRQIIEIRRMLIGLHRPLQ